MQQQSDYKGKERREEKRESFGKLRFLLTKTMKSSHLLEFEVRGISRNCPEVVHHLGISPAMNPWAPLIGVEGLAKNGNTSFVLPA